MVTMTRPKTKQHRRGKRSAVPPEMTLARWRLRETWHLLLVAALGIIAAVALICAVPLFSNFSRTAGLRAVLNASPQDSEILISINASSLTEGVFAQQFDQPMNTFIHQRLGTYISKPAQFILQTQGMTLPSGDDMTLLGFNMQEAAHHATIIQGRLPLPRSDELEIAVTQKTADALHVTVGSLLPVSLSFFKDTHQLTSRMLTLHIVGIFTPNGDPFWQGYTFDATTLGPFLGFRALMSTSTYLGVLTQMADTVLGKGNEIIFVPDQRPFLNWHYQLDVNSISFDDLDNLIARLATIQLALLEEFNRISSDSIQTISPLLPSNGSASTLERYRDRADVAAIPANILALQVLALALFFVSMIADLLVERQTGVIALLRSRGASRRHIFGSLAIQSVGVGLIALVTGPLLAILAVRLSGPRLLAPSDQSALNVLDGNPFQVALTVHWYALAAAASAVFAMILAVHSSTSQDVLTIRREAARSTRQPLWRRLNLDIIFIIIALTGFALSLYVSNSGALDAQTNLLISTPLALVAPMLLSVAGMLLFLRFFPLFLQLGARLSARRPGAPAMVAVAQMARSPRQVTRMILLLALASSFGIFALIFNASQAQHIRAITAHEVGADFSGTLPPNPIPPRLLDEQTDAYRHIPGVLSASLGYSTHAVPAGNGQSLSLELKAIDTSTYAQTIIWTDQDSSQPLSSLMDKLTHASPLAPSALPVIVDERTWEALDLHEGATFAVTPAGAAEFITLVAVAKVHHIPTVNDSLSGGSGNYSPPGGILINYHTYTATNIEDEPEPLNQVWLRTTDDPALLAKVRAALSNGPLALKPFFDRRAMIAQAESDPLYINLVTALVLGAATAILLALVGNLITSWLSARSRLTSFALLRALGSPPIQLARILLWEQGIVYSAALALGIILGGLLALAVVPALVFSSIPQARDITSSEFYVIQRVLPAQIVIPPSLLIAFALLIILCMIALSMMARIVSKPSISQTLRLNED